MDPNQYVLISEFCECHHVEYSFINSLNEHGLLEINVIDRQEYVEREKVRELEKMMRLHYDLEINMAGIDAINHLLQRITELQEKTKKLENRLRRYEE